MKRGFLFLFGAMVFMTVHAQNANEAVPVDLSKLEQHVLKHEKEIAQLKSLKISGYLQSQFQYGEEEASLKTGASKGEMEKSFYRFGVRRGRLKFEYEKSLITGVFQMDMTEKGIGLKDAYLAMKAPWLGSSSIKVGLFNRPFGHEISYSSSRRESPERATIITTLFPEERDLGAMLTLQAAKDSPWSIMKLEAALIGGNGIKPDMDNRKDVILRLSASKSLGKKISLSAGVSCYNGGVYQATDNVYRMKEKSFVIEPDLARRGEFAKREYFGIDGQFSVTGLWGMSQLAVEYITGTQPGEKNSSKSPNYSTIPSSDTYIRPFRGGYVSFVQDMGRWPLAMIVKYDFYDPNTGVSQHDIGLHETGKADIAYSTFGGGVLWRVNSNVRLTAYYDRTLNEKTNNMAAYNRDLKDNVFTMRLQYKF